MIHLLELLDAVFGITNLCQYWRFWLGLLGGVAVAVGGAFWLPQNPFFWMLEGAVVVTGGLAGWRWEVNRG